MKWHMPLSDVICYISECKRFELQSRNIYIYTDIRERKSLWNEMKFGELRDWVLKVKNLQIGNKYFSDIIISFMYLYTCILLL
jgi:hypothetical protein